MALGGGRAYCYAESDHSPAGDWRELFAGFAGPVRDLVEQGAGAHVGAVEEVSVDTPVAGRTVLVGDAAHANPPNMAQGAAMAFEDAIVLADHLSRLPRRGAVVVRHPARAAGRVGAHPDPPARQRGTCPRRCATR